MEDISWLKFSAALTGKPTREETAKTNWVRWNSFQFVFNCQQVKCQTLVHYTIRLWEFCLQAVVLVLKDRPRLTKNHTVKSTFPPLQREENCRCDQQRSRGKETRVGFYRVPTWHEWQSNISKSRGEIPWSEKYEVTLG